jgi:hypothetical protein
MDLGGESLICHFRTGPGVAVSTVDFEAADFFVLLKNQGRDGQITRCVRGLRHFRRFQFPGQARGWRSDPNVWQAASPISGKVAQSVILQASERVYGKLAAKSKGRVRSSFDSS